MDLCWKVIWQAARVTWVTGNLKEAALQGAVFICVTASLCSFFEGEKSINGKEERPTQAITMKEQKFTVGQLSNTAVIQFLNFEGTKKLLQLLK